MDELTRIEAEVIDCRRCPRLVAYRERIAQEKRKAYRDWDYWGKPVPGFGDPRAQVLVVGLAPGAHGSNRTGRMFTGDASGDFLYPALFNAGFASQPKADSREDALVLHNMFITAVGRCAPPDNKPTPQELDTCQPFLEAELRALTELKVVVALGKIAFDRMLQLWKRQGYLLAPAQFGHGAGFRVHAELPYLLASYHPSRQNTQTGRLTAAMFADIWNRAQELLNED
jgi:uracil-DNA glycosylase family 4